MNKTYVGAWAEDDLIRAYFVSQTDPLDDDAALLSPPPDHDLVVSTDALVEGVHFTADSPAHLVGQKAVRANISDVLAGGGEARWATLSLCLPQRTPITWLAGFAEGLRGALSQFDMRLVGGDTTASPGGITISLTVLGVVPRGASVSRGGAAPGHSLAVTGCLGDASIGLKFLLDPHCEPASQRDFWLQRHFCRPLRPLFARRAARAGLISAMMDLSDGLAVDLPRLCRTSRVGARVELSLIPLSQESRHFSLQPEQAWAAGEDYELLLTFPEENRVRLEELARETQTPLTILGEITEGLKIDWYLQKLPFYARAEAWRHFS